MTASLIYSILVTEGIMWSLIGVLIYFARRARRAKRNRR